MHRRSPRVRYALDQAAKYQEHSTLSDAIPRWLLADRLHRRPLCDEAGGLGVHHNFPVVLDPQDRSTVEQLVHWHE